MIIKIFLIKKKLKLLVKISVNKFNGLNKNAFKKYNPNKNVFKKYNPNKNAFNKYNPNKNAFNKYNPNKNAFNKYIGPMTCLFLVHNLFYLIQQFYFVVYVQAMFVLVQLYIPVPIQM